VDVLETSHSESESPRPDQVIKKLLINPCFLPTNWLDP